jgi:hypothetical protein
MQPVTFTNEADYGADYYVFPGISMFKINGDMDIELNSITKSPTSFTA